MAADIIDSRGLFKLVCDPLQNAWQARLNRAVICPATVPFSGEKAVLLQHTQMARHYRPGDFATLGKLPYRRNPLNDGLHQANPNGMSNYAQKFCRVLQAAVAHSRLFLACLHDVVPTSPKVRS